MSTDQSGHSSQEESDDRHETETERLDRNWGDLLQELRVIQTGVQLLTGFLLTLPFQQRFTSVPHVDRVILLITAAAAIIATAFLQAPVVVHRALFQRHRRRETVMLAHKMAIVGTTSLAIAVVGVSFLIASAVVGVGAGIAAAAAAVVLLGVLWLAMPITARHRTPAAD